ncbi:MAG: M1 family metallopeptidase [Phaeodactylibacter sp.]|nr:M1 family metallopeptidase [Phaeodactylibacter sp.]MCB9050306.1 M1 family metallopeptidase [Lewinellaceae bacterium]
MNYWKLLALLFLGPVLVQAQPERWQQRAEYQMVIDFDAKEHQFKGAQRLVYHNNSPDTLFRVFYHLYFNAFQPNSMMDVRSRTIVDSDPRVGSRIYSLGEKEIGYHEINSLKMDGQPVRYEVAGTILEVELERPVLPNSQAVFEMEFQSQVPLQIRRSGRDNAEGIAYSMSQWYPKMCEYDYQGWHANPYIGREFYGIWGDFDVTINIGQEYTVAASGYLQNPEEIGHGYSSQASKSKSKKLSYHFIAPNVHDFVWAADPDYTHDTFTRKDGTVLHFFYQKNENTEEAWGRLPEIMDKAFDFININYGQYPYKQYSFIQGGDGGMEYPMATLITGERSLGSLVGVSVHELMHSWYQMVLGTNESLYAWMDEGFTSWASDEVMNYLRGEGLIPGRKIDNPHASDYQGYVNFARSGFEEPLITHADHFVTNTAYGIAAYVKGAVFLAQLEYIIGREAFRKGMLRYFDTWKFKHPNSNDFIRVMEKQSGLELDWYLEYWANTTHTIDYAVQKVEAAEERGGKTVVTLEKPGIMPMPLDVLVVYADGRRQMYNIPLRIMRGHKPVESSTAPFKVVEDWPWVNPTYELILDAAPEEILEVIIDPEGGMADINRDNNTWRMK